MEQPTLFDFQTKECRTCHEVLPATDSYFRVGIGSQFGLRAHCKKCERTKGNARNARKRMDGECKACGRAALPGKSLCEPCFVINRQRDQALRARRQAEGTCRNCGAPSDKSRCSDCRAIEKTQLQYAACRRAGICVVCRQPVMAGALSCEGCIDQVLVHKAKQRPLGRVCTLCQKNRALYGTRRCGPCKAATEKRRGNHQELLLAAKAKVHAAYGGKCVCCGETEPLFLTIDHINGDGKTDLGARSGNKRKYYERIIAEDFPGRYQLLCQQCNWAKGQYGRCPHKGEPLYMPHSRRFNRGGRPRTLNPASKGVNDGVE